MNKIKRNIVIIEQLYKITIKYIFFWFYLSIGFGGNIKYAKKGIASAIECADELDFTFVT